MVTDLQWAPTPSATLNIPASLDSGQCFRWIAVENGGRLGTIGDSAVLLRPEEDGFWWQTYPVHGRWDLIERYFALDVDLEQLYGRWITNEPRIASSIRRHSGLRILRQDAEEALFSFLCASCNTVVKIRRSVQALARHCGEAVADIDGLVIYRFPDAATIASVGEDFLRRELWGYRAPRLIEMARTVASRGDDWLDSLRHCGYRAAHAELTAHYGVGPKVADCICLFALWYDEAVPIDTHVRQVAVRLFHPELAHKTLTPTVYEKLASLFRDRFGGYAGWAQQYLFFDELNHTEGV